MSNLNCPECWADFAEWRSKPLQPVGAGACPGCDEPALVPIAYGYPGPDMALRAQMGLIVLGGCVVDSGAPSHVCRQCGICIRNSKGTWLAARGRDLDGRAAMIPLDFRTTPVAPQLTARFQGATSRLDRPVIATVYDLDGMLPEMFIGAGWWTEVEGIDVACSEDCLDETRTSDAIELSSYEFITMLAFRGGRRSQRRPTLLHVFHSEDRAGAFVLLENGRLEVLAGEGSMPDAARKELESDFGAVLSG